MEINYQWEQLSIMFGQLGEAAERLGDCGVCDREDAAHALAILPEEAEAYRG